MPDTPTTPISDLDTFSSSASKLAKNPLGIIALFIVLIYAVAALIFGLSKPTLSELNVTMLVSFLVAFPIVVLFVFRNLVVNHSGNLYAPEDFKDENNYIKVLTQSDKELEMTHQQELAPRYGALASISSTNISNTSTATTSTLSASTATTSTLSASTATASTASMSNASAGTTTNNTVPTNADSITTPPETAQYTGTGMTSAPPQATTPTAQAANGTAITTISWERENQLKMEKMITAEELAVQRISLEVGTVLEPHVKLQTKDGFIFADGYGRVNDQTIFVEVKEQFSKTRNAFYSYINKVSDLIRSLEARKLPMKNVTIYLVLVLMYEENESVKSDITDRLNEQLQNIKTKMKLMTRVYTYPELTATQEVSMSQEAGMLQ